MSQKTRAELKTFFETGDKPTQQEFHDLLDSYYNITDDVLPVFSHMVSGGGTDKIYDEVQLMSSGDVLVVDSGVYVENQAAGIAKQGISIYCMPNVSINRTWTTPLFDCTAITEFYLFGKSKINCQYKVFQGPTIVSTEFVFEAIEFKSTDDITFYFYGSTIDYFSIKGRVLSAANSFVYIGGSTIDIFCIDVADIAYTPSAYGFNTAVTRINYLHISGNKFGSGSDAAIYLYNNNINTLIDVNVLGLGGGAVYLRIDGSRFIINSNVYGSVYVGSSVDICINGTTNSSSITVFYDTSLVLNSVNYNLSLNNQSENPVIVNGSVLNSLSIPYPHSRGDILFFGSIHLSVSALLQGTKGANIFFYGDIIVDDNFYIELYRAGDPCNYYFFCKVFGNVSDGLIRIIYDNISVYLNTSSIIINNSSDATGYGIKFNNDSKLIHNGGLIFVNSLSQSINVIAAKTVSITNLLNYWTNYSRGGAGTYTEQILIGTGDTGGTEKVNSNLSVNLF